jgi:branched-subunit amino acid aminotransferase/4-amino-4-deoxychorismate lyase
VRKVKVKGKPGYRWGKRGKVYTYKTGNLASQQRAKKKAQAQGRAAFAAGYRPK